MTLENWRDIVVIVYGAMGILLMLALCLAAFGLWFAVRALSSTVQDLINDQVKGTLNEVQKTVQNVRGTSEFVADSAVSPLIRVLSVGRGIRRGISTVTGLRNRTRK